MILQAVSDLTYVPQRIISVVPSQTELLYTLGLEEQTIGITKFCVHPAAWFHTKTRVGGTKTIDINKINLLKPDLIIANKEENVKEQVEELAKDHAVWVTDINNLDDALQMINNIGAITGTANKAGGLINKIQRNFTELDKSIVAQQETENSKLKTVPRKPKTAYLIWRKPYMAAGGGTFIHDMLNRWGFQNIFAGQTRYPQISIEQLKTENCQLLLLSSEPYPFKQKHIDELQQYLPGCKILLVDGEMFSWYGSRLLYAADYFKQLISACGA